MPGTVNIAPEEADGDVAATGSARRTLWTSNRAGSIDVSWTWSPSAGGGYHGRFQGRFTDRAPNDGRWVILQARWEGRGWTPVATAANGGTFDRNYQPGTRGLNFRACLTGGYCGSPAW
ncbi:hypothetical protein [Marinitenerispora sediminis]|uniref:Uncharacterized protein n=1 Tax=Marinitenerispora sediminis TaxID=1931232 RepID=A0A368T5Q7_9ACTN|nr:hypothetical protein [Marinitenerispora sediminis]RCV51869.1 hypothetical protein DEF28_14470 [Marinitenerispora sediminis]RCV54808.1 hypothetical protein DEF23_15235 [Marinitenerispora sediminis]RCV58954.1 hypothetical protein DEF24_11555 [Marinitenerispora sediminis]